MTAAKTRASAAKGLTAISTPIREQEQRDPQVAAERDSHEVGRAQPSGHHHIEQVLEHVNPANPRLALGFVPRSSLPYFAESIAWREGRADIDRPSGPR